MAISAIYGFQHYKNMVNTSTTDLMRFGRLPFFADDYSFNYASWTNIRNDSTFQFALENGRVWLKSVTSTFNRAPISSCVCTNLVTYHTPVWCSARRRYSSTAQVQQTNYNRYRDSLGRTPTMFFSFRDVFGDELEIEDKRYFTIGFRVKFYNGTDSFNGSVLRVDRSYQTNHTGGTTIFPTNISLDENNEAYLEATFDRQTGMVRRWVNDVSIGRISINSSQLRDFNDLTFYINQRSTSTAGLRQPDQTNTGPRNNPPSCPPTVGSFDTGAPPRCDYAVNDFYFSTNDTDEEDFNHHRLGPVEVDVIKLDDVLVDRFWQIGNESPIDTVGRIKVSDSSDPNRFIAGDTHSPPATVRLKNIILPEDEEILYLEGDVHAFKDGGGANYVIVDLSSNDGTGSVVKELPTGSIGRGSDGRRSFRLEKKNLLDDPGNSLENVTLKITFEE